MNAPEPIPASPEPAEPGGIEIAPSVRLPADCLRFSFSSSRGPGGQNVNKKATKAELRVRLQDIPIHPRALERLAAMAGQRIAGSDELLIVADEFRSQSQNRTACLERLRELIIRSMVVPKVRRATKPSRGSKERRLEAKRTRGQAKARRRSTGEE